MGSEHGPAHLLGAHRGRGLRCAALQPQRLEKRGRAVELDRETIAKLTRARDEVLIAKAAGGRGTVQLWGEWATGLFGAYRSLR